MYKFILLFSLTASFIWASEFTCTMPGFAALSRPWDSSPDFMRLTFEGDLAKERFKDIGTAGDRFFSVVVHKDWCRPLQEVIMCETPMSAMAEIESSSGPNSPATKTPLRYFLMILNYREDGWAMLRVRAHRLDTHFPISFLMELPSRSCEVSPE